MRCNPLSSGLNAAILHIANRLFPTGFDVADAAPDTFEKLIDGLNHGGRMTVWNGGSDRTIYCDREVNFAFRAWHDWCHWRGGFPFTDAGEASACEMQIGHLVTLYGDTPTTRHWADILRAEINGQAEYLAARGDFPADQFAFVTTYLADKSAALLV